MRTRADWAIEDLAAEGDESAMDEVRSRNNVDPYIRVAIVGSPNSGKSSLINRLLGFDRNRVTDDSVTTRDAIETPCLYRGRRLRIIDTAGVVRRYKRTAVDFLRELNNVSIRAIQYAHVVVVCFDATLGHPSGVDMNLVQHAVNEGRCVLLCATKWDDVLDHMATAESIDYKIKQQLTEVRFVQAVVTSALQGSNMTLLMDQVLEVYDTWNKRVRNGDLNRFWRRYEKSIVIPHHVSRVVHVSQVSTRPPTFTLKLQTRSEDKILNQLQLSTLRNAIAEEFDFNGVPLRFIQNVKEKHPDVV
jgi:GTP-binding protein